MLFSQFRDTYLWNVRQLRKTYCCRSVYDTKNIVCSFNTKNQFYILVKITESKVCQHGQVLNMSVKILSVVG